LTLDGESVRHSGGNAGPRRFRLRWLCWPLRACCGPMWDGRSACTAPGRSSSFWCFHCCSYTSADLAAVRRCLLHFFTSACVLLALSWLLVLIPQNSVARKVPGRAGEGLHHPEWHIYALLFCAAQSRRRHVGQGTGKIRASRRPWRSSSSATSFSLPSAELPSSSSPSCSCCSASKHFERRALAVFVAAGVALAAVLRGRPSPYLRFRVMHIV